MIQDGDKRRAHVNSVVNVRVPQNAVLFFFFYWVRKDQLSKVILFHVISYLLCLFLCLFVCLLVKISRLRHRNSKFSTLVQPISDTGNQITERNSACKKSAFLSHVGNCQPKILLNFLFYLTRLVVIPEGIASKVKENHGSLISSISL